MLAGRHTSLYWMMMILLRVSTTISPSTPLSIYFYQGELPSQDDDETWDSYGGKISLRSWAKGFHRYANDAKTAAATLNEAMGGRGVSFMQFDIDDMGVIQPLSKLHFLIMTLEALVLSRGENVYIHCWGGCGRTGIVGSALLGALYKDLSSDDALAHVDSYFKLRSERALFPHSVSESDIIVPSCLPLHTMLTCIRIVHFFPTEIPRDRPTEGSGQGIF